MFHMFFLCFVLVWIPLTFFTQKNSFCYHNYFYTLQNSITPANFVSHTPSPHIKYNNKNVATTTKETKIMFKQSHKKPQQVNNISTLNFVCKPISAHFPILFLFTFRLTHTHFIYFIETSTSCTNKQTHTLMCPLFFL